MSGTNKNSTSWNFHDCRDSPAKKTNLQIFRQRFFHNFKIFDADPDRGDKGCCFCEKYFEKREKFKLGGFLWIFRTIRMQKHWRKTMIFYLNTLYKGCVFDWDLKEGKKTFLIDPTAKSTSRIVWTVRNLLHGSTQNKCWLNHPQQAKSFYWRRGLEKSYL